MRLFKYLTVLLLAFASPALVQRVQAQTTELKPLPRFEHPDLKHASTLIEKRQYFDAIAELQALKVQDPRQKGVDHELGAAYYKLGDYTHANEALQRAIAEDDKDKESVQLLGLSYFFSGHSKDAIPLLEQVQSWFPRAHVDASYVLGI